jgi:hypothetical protein
MAIIKSSNGIEIIVDDDKFEDLNRFKWWVNKSNYVLAYYGKKLNGNQKNVFMHRYLTNCPDNLVVDHINANRLDNRLENLEIVTQAENLKRIKHGLGHMESQLRRYFQSLEP